ncbi:MAG: hypothetical protein ACYTF6_14295, partial [Planctomycetota bacterium]
EIILNSVAKDQMAPLFREGGKICSFHILTPVGRISEHYYGQATPGCNSSALECAHHPPPLSQVVMRFPQ